MVGSMTIAAKADNPPTDNENAAPTTEDSFVSITRPDCIPEGWQSDGELYSARAVDDNESQSVYVWYSSACGTKEYKVAICGLGCYCRNAYYDASEHIMTFYYPNDTKYQFRY